MSDNGGMITSESYTGNIIVRYIMNNICTFMKPNRNFLRNTLNISFKIVFQIDVYHLLCIKHAYTHASTHTFTHTGNMCKWRGFFLQDISLARGICENVFEGKYYPSLNVVKALILNSPSRFCSDDTLNHFNTNLYSN